MLAQVSSCTGLIVEHGHPTASGCVCGPADGGCALELNAADGRSCTPRGTLKCKRMCSEVGGVLFLGHSLATKGVAAPPVIAVSFDAAEGLCSCRLPRVVEIASDTGSSGMHAAKPTAGAACPCAADQHTAHQQRRGVVTGGDHARPLPALALAPHRAVLHSFIMAIFRRKTAPGEDVEASQLSKASAAATDPNGARRARAQPCRQLEARIPCGAGAGGRLPVRVPAPSLPSAAPRGLRSGGAVHRPGARLVAPA